MGIDKSAITAKVEARNAADVVHRLAMDESLNHKNEACLAFWRRMLENVCAVLPPEYHPTRVVERGPHAPMTDEDSKGFENKSIPFGKYIGQQISSVPLSYLCWLDDQPDFRRELNRYLRSERIQAEQEQHEAAGGEDE